MPRKTKGVAAETTAIVLRIAADHATDFEATFEAEEIPIWDDFTRRGRFLEARLVRASGGSEQRGGVQDYILHIVAADHEPMRSTTATRGSGRSSRRRSGSSRPRRWSGSATRSLNAGVERTTRGVVR